MTRGRGFILVYPIKRFTVTESFSFCITNHLFFQFFFVDDFRMNNYLMNVANYDFRTSCR